MKKVKKSINAQNPHLPQAHVIGRIGVRQRELLDILNDDKFFIQAYKCYSPLKKTEYDLCDEDGNIYKAIRDTMITSLLNKNLIYESSKMSSLISEIIYYKLKSKATNSHK